MMDFDIDEYDIDPLWKLHDELTVTQAAQLIAGYNPAWVDLCRRDTNFAARFPRIYPAETALINAINAKKLKATIRVKAWEAGFNEFPSDDEGFRSLTVEELISIGHQEKTSTTLIYHQSPDWGLTTVALDDLKAWLISRNVKEGFFFSDTPDTIEYLDPKHLRYAPKLAAAVQAWQAVTSNPKTTPKQALAKWLRENAARLGLSDGDGKANETAIEEISKITNWQPGGGASKTYD